MSCLTVAEVNRIIKTDLESNPFLKSIQVSGEISNLKKHSSGHFYFALKDDQAKVNCVMFASYASRVDFKLSDGDKVVVTCSVGVYPTNGSYQLMIYSIQPVGIGDLYLKFEELKKKLYKEGLFDESHKTKLPKYPVNIGVISAKEGAAIHDIITTITRRWPLAQITLIPSLVQGKLATDDLIKNIEFADKQGFDEIIIARGGGSIEDLWCFNEERVAYAVYNMQTPVISAIGHEVDFTIIDYVADLRAPTPTGAGEIGTPNILELRETIESYKQSLIVYLKNILDNKQQQIEYYKNNPYLSHVEHLFADKYSKLVLLEERLVAAKNSILNRIENKLSEYNYKIRDSFEKMLNNSRNSLTNYEIQLDNLSPLKIMDRGYGIIKKDNKVMNDISNIKIDDHLNIQMRDGNVDVTVNKINKGE